MTQSRSRRKGETDTISGQVAFLWCIVCVRQVSRDFPVGFYSPDTKEGDSRQWRDFLLGSNPFHNSAAFSMQKTRGKTNIGRTRSAVRCIANKMISSKGTSCRGTQVFWPSCTAALCCCIACLSRSSQSKLLWKNLWRMHLGLWLFLSRYRLAMASGGTVHVGVWFKPSIHLAVVFVVLIHNHHRVRQVHSLLELWRIVVDKTKPRCKLL